MDGHSTHLTYNLSELCKELEIILICLYPNATRLLQSADVAAFKPIKTGWKKAVLNWRKQNLNKILSKEKFAPVLEKVIEQYGKAKTIQNGFKATGLYPFNPDAIDFSKCLGQNDEILKDNFDVDVSKTINYETFRKIVGEEMIFKLKADSNFCDGSTERNIFYNLLKQFSKQKENETYLDAELVEGHTEKESEIPDDGIQALDTNDTFSVGDIENGLLQTITYLTYPVTVGPH